MRTWFAALVMLASSPAGAQVCSAPAPLPAELAAFARPVPVPSGGGLVVGKAASLALVPDARFLIPPAHAPSPGSYGGRAFLDVVAAGTYRVALGEGAWIDVVRNGKAISSIAHNHGPACSPVRKVVDFTLSPGRYVVQLSGAKQSYLTVLVARLP